MESDHKHVVLDEDVFHIYQDIATAARTMSNVGVMKTHFAFHLNKLDEALDRHGERAPHYPHDMKEHTE